MGEKYCALHRKGSIRMMIDSGLWSGKIEGSVSWDAGGGNVCGFYSLSISEGLDQAKFSGMLICRNK